MSPEEYAALDARLDVLVKQMEQIVAGMERSLTVAERVAAERDALRAQLDLLTARRNEDVERIERLTRERDEAKKAIASNKGAAKVRGTR